MMLFAVVEEVPKVGVEFWVITICATLVSALTAIGGVILAAIAITRRVMAALRDLKKDVKENTDAQATILPALTVKVDSAEKKADEATSEAKKLVVTAAEHVGNAIGEKVAKNTKDAADVVASVAAKNQEVMAESVGRISDAIKGPDGTCLTGKVANLEIRMAKVEDAVTNGFDKILSELKTKAEIEEVKTREERHNKRDAEYATQLIEQARHMKERMDRLAADVQAMKGSTVVPPAGDLPNRAVKAAERTASATERIAETEKK